MTRRIHLVRHGRSAIEHDGRWITCECVREYAERYNTAGIRDDDAPPAPLMDLVRAADVIATSHLELSVASARRLAPARVPLVEINHCISCMR
jgi:hypothetical protein